MLVLTGFSFMFAGGYQNGKSAGENEMRNRVVLYSSFIKLNTLSISDVRNEILTLLNTYVVYLISHKNV
jgi:hypothetical protein